MHIYTAILFLTPLAHAFIADFGSLPAEPPLDIVRDVNGAPLSEGKLNEYRAAAEAYEDLKPALAELGIEVRSGRNPDDPMTFKAFVEFNGGQPNLQSDTAQEFNKVCDPRRHGCSKFGSDTYAKYFGTTDGRVYDVLRRCLEMLQILEPTEGSKLSIRPLVRSFGTGDTKGLGSRRFNVANAMIQRVIRNFDMQKKDGASPLYTADEIEELTTIYNGNQDPKQGPVGEKGFRIQGKVKLQATVIEKVMIYDAQKPAHDAWKEMKRREDELRQRELAERQAAELEAKQLADKLALEAKLEAERREKEAEEARIAAQPVLKCCRRENLQGGQWGVSWCLIRKFDPEGPNNEAGTKIKCNTYSFGQIQFSEAERQAPTRCAEARAKQTAGYCDCLHAPAVMAGDGVCQNVPYQGGNKAGSTEEEREEGDLNVPPSSLKQDKPEDVKPEDPFAFEFDPFNGLGDMMMDLDGPPRGKRRRPANKG